MVTVEDVFAAYVKDKAVAAQYVRSIVELMEEDPRDILFHHGFRTKDTEILLTFYAQGKGKFVEIYIDVPPLKEPDTWHTSNPSRRHRRRS